jgi:hypothetical protein
VLENNAHNLKERGWNLGCVSAIDSEGRTIWIADAHRDGKRFIVRADDKLPAVIKLESAIRLDEQAREFASAYVCK